MTRRERLATGVGPCAPGIDAAHVIELVAEQIERASERERSPFTDLQARAARLASRNGAGRLSTNGG